MVPRESYSTLTLEDKMEINKKAECGWCKTEISAEFGIKNNTCSTYLKNKEFILKSWENGWFAKGWKHMRTVAHEDLEKHFLIWANDTLVRNVPLSGHILAIEKKELALLMDVKNFSCSEGYRWYALSKISCGECGAADLAVCNEFCEKLPELISCYGLKDVLIPMKQRCLINFFLIRL